MWIGLPAPIECTVSDNPWHPGTGVCLLCFVTENLR